MINDKCVYEITQMVGCSAMCELLHEIKIQNHFNCIYLQNWGPNVFVLRREERSY